MNGSLSLACPKTRSPRGVRKYQRSAGDRPDSQTEAKSSSLDASPLLTFSKISVGSGSVGQHVLQHAEQLAASPLSAAPPP